MNALIDKLTHLGYALPAPPAPGGNYLPWRQVGDLLFLAGVISANVEGVIKGRLGQDLNLEQGYAAARCCALTQLASIQAAVGSLERVKQIVTLNGYVCCTAEFTNPPRVINGASDLLVALFGDPGRHVRAAIGVMSLPMGAAVEVQMTVQIFPS
ncbi:MAG TPA: RidA family protein [Candidatus Methylacidiphilales bacterium]